MILADTSVWVDHLRTGVPLLAASLERGAVLVHPFVVGELACGKLKRRAAVLQLLQDLPQAIVGSDVEVLSFIERNALMGRGIGHIDMHLLAAAALSAPAKLWTRDKRLASIATELKLTFSE